MNTDKLNNLIQEYRNTTAPIDFSIAIQQHATDNVTRQWITIPRLTIASSMLAVLLVITILIQPDTNEQLLNNFPDIGQLSDMNTSMANINFINTPNLGDLEQLPELSNISAEIIPTNKHKPESKTAPHQGSIFFKYTHS